MVEQWVKDLVRDEMGESAMVIGQVVQHPDGRQVKVIDGQLWAPGGFSNFWTWQEVFDDGSLGPKENGYGWSKSETAEAEPPSMAP